VREWKVFRTLSVYPLGEPASSPARCVGRTFRPNGTTAWRLNEGWPASAEVTPQPKRKGFNLREAWTTRCMLRVSLIRLDVLEERRGRVEAARRSGTRAVVGATAAHRVHSTLSGAAEWLSLPPPGRLALAPTGLQVAGAGASVALVGHGHGSPCYRPQPAGGAVPCRSSSPTVTGPRIAFPPGENRWELWRCR
jgi:hypothetical protein